jgi:cysteine-rich repeat protein
MSRRTGSAALALLLWFAPWAAEAQDFVVNPFLFNAASNVEEGFIDGPPGMATDFTSSPSLNGSDTIEDAFGNGDGGEEAGNFIFADDGIPDDGDGTPEPAVETVDFIAWETAEPVAVSGYRMLLTAESDPPRDTEVIVFYVDGVALRQNDINGINGGQSILDISRSFPDGTVTGSQFRVEFTRTTTNGPRIEEVDALAPTFCGNAIVDDHPDFPEECDDGNYVDDDGCTPVCVLQCGNGELGDDPGEECDDGGRVSGDGCDEFCLIEICGNGRTEANEECDDGNSVGGDGCDAVCLLECGNGVFGDDPAEECDDGGRVSGDGCDAFCLVEICGNDRQEANEQCEDGNTVAGDGCDSMCMHENCGDGVVDPLEECDDGNTVPSDGCEVGCLTSCGNGTKDLFEECDDGNRVSGDGCDEMCLVEVCGNGRKEGNEDCDDGNTVAGDGCDEICLLECGNGALGDDPAEECDDGGRVSGDGCDEFCLVEICGNSRTEANEGCDDGNAVAGDGCDGLCQSEAQRKDQQKCINALNKSGASVIKAQAKAALKCIKAAGKGKEGDPQACVSGDRDGKVEKAQAKTSSKASRSCDALVPPTFAYSGAEAVNEAGKEAARGMVSDILSMDVNLTVDDQAGACQADVLKIAQKLLDIQLKQAGKATKNALSGKKGPQATSGEELRIAVLAALEDGEEKLVAEAVKVPALKKCQEVNIAVFAACAQIGAVTVTDCAVRSGLGRFCLAINAFDDLGIDCGEYVNPLGLLD